MATTIKSRKKNQQKSVPTLLQAIEKVVELAEDSKMSEEFMLKAAPEISQRALALQNDRLCCSASVWRKDREGWIMMIWPRIWI